MMEVKRKHDLLATDVMPTEATLEIRQLIAAALETLQLPMDAFESTGNSEIATSNRIHSLGLDKLKRVPKLQPSGSVHSSDLALRLFYSCRKAEVVTIFASKDSEISIVDSPLRLAALCVDALKLELSRRPYRHIVRVWLPEKEDIALGALPDRVLVQMREFATCKSNDAIYPILTAALPLMISYRDDAVIVVDKPANALSIDGTDPNASISVHRCIANVYPGARMVHRLDQETSGLLVVALTKSAAQSLNAQFRGRSVEKTYVARVHGWIEEESESPRSVRLPMEKHPTQPLVQRVVLDRKVDPSSSLWSLTEYCVRSRAIDGTQTGEDRKSTMLSLTPVTGKTHQLRLHMQHIGHPILGDSLYSPELVYHRASRLCLHAAKLSFAHPVTNERLSFESSCPADFFTTKESKSAMSQRPTACGSWPNVHIRPILAEEAAGREITTRGPTALSLRKVNRMQEKVNEHGLLFHLGKETPALEVDVVSGLTNPRRRNVQLDPFGDDQVKKGSFKTGFTMAKERHTITSRHHFLL